MDSGRPFSVPANTTCTVDPDEIIYRAVVARFHVIGKITGRQLPGPPVRSDTVAAGALLAAGIAAVTVHKVPLLLAVHLFFTGKIVFFDASSIGRRNTIRQQSGK